MKNPMGLSSVKERCPDTLLIPPIEGQTVGSHAQPRVVGRPIAEYLVDLKTLMHN